MTNPSPDATGPAGYLVLDPDLPFRPPLARARTQQQALGAVGRLQAQFHDQLDANGEGGFRAELALSIAPVDATGTIGPACYWAIINGMRPADR